MSQITKQALANSLKKLLQTTPLDKITVKELVGDCGVNRQTFYYHFQDIYDLLEWAFNQKIQIVFADHPAFDTWQDGVLKLLCMLQQDAVAVKNVYHSNGKDYLERYVYRMMYDILFHVIHKLAQGKKVALKDQQFIAKFYKFAFAGMLLEWINTGMKESPEAILADLSKLIAGDFQRALEKYETQ